MQLLVLKLEDYMLPCLNKKFLGYECMGCGLQRSVSLLLQGEFIQAFYMYPAIYSIIALFGFIIINHFKNFKSGFKIITILALLNVVIIMVSFFIKLYSN